MGPGVINFDTPPPGFDSISSSSGSELGERGLQVFDPSDLSPSCRPLRAESCPLNPIHDVTL